LIFGDPVRRQSALVRTTDLSQTSHHVRKVPTAVVGFRPWAARLHKHADQKVLICDGPRPPTKPDAEKLFFLSPPKSSYILGMEVGVRW
jgi:hypothetical protein